MFLFRAVLIPFPALFIALLLHFLGNPCGEFLTFCDIMHSQVCPTLAGAMPLRLTWKTRCSVSRTGCLCSLAPLFLHSKSTADLGHLQKLAARGSRWTRTSGCPEASFPEISAEAPGENWQWTERSIVCSRNLPYRHLEDGLSEAGFVRFAFSRVRDQCPISFGNLHYPWKRGHKLCSLPPSPWWSEDGLSIMHSPIVASLSRSLVSQVVLKFP